MNDIRRIAMSDGAELQVFVDGQQDGVPVTFTHSLAASSAMWEPQMAALSDRFRIVRIDLRGHGGSSVTPAPSGFPRLARDVVEVWDALGIARSHYVGLSLGGIIGAGLGIDDQDRLLRLVLADCRFNSTEPYLATWARRRAILTDGGMAAIARDTLPTWLNPGHIASDPSLVAELIAGIEATDPQGWLGIVDIFPSLDYKKDLGKIGVPTLFATGEQDAVRGEMQECSGLVPGAAFREIPDANHLANLDRPAEFTDLLASFLGGD